MRFEEALVEARKGKMIKRRGAGHIYRTFSEGLLGILRNTYMFHYQTYKVRKILLH